MLRIISLLLGLFINTIFADNFPTSVFPMSNYPQQINHWIKIESGVTLINAKLQNKRFAGLKSHYFGINKDDQSPWSPYFVKNVLRGNSNKNIYLSENNNILRYNNMNNAESMVGYGINYLPYTSEWTNKLRNNMQLAQFNNVQFNLASRAIAVDNLDAFSVPTRDPWYLDYRIAGNGFPFNDNQLSNIYLGTPLYVIGKSLDKQWLLVLTPQLIGWVRATGVAYVSDNFISSWNNWINRSMVSIVRPNVSMVSRNDVLLNSALAGTILPIENKTESGFFVFIPERGVDGIAFVATAFVNNNDAQQVPMLATASNIVMLINNLLGRPYGWGGYLGYNDCSSELQAIFTTLGFYMPRNSAQQSKMGVVIDLTKYSPVDRMNYLVKYGVPFMTLVHIPGHIMLYLGNVQFNNQTVPLVYEDVWGMRKNGENIRYIIGKSVIFPLLINYPESATFSSYFDKNSFKITTMNSTLTDYSVINDLY